jgi:hypothetical protein
MTDQNKENFHLFTPNIPNWAIAIRPFIDIGGGMEYPDFNLWKEGKWKFLDGWTKTKQYEKLKLRLQSLGYLDDRDWPTKRLIMDQDKQEILSISKELYSQRP